MQDVKLEQLNDGTFDMIIDEDNKQYETVDGFETALYFQLFTNQRVTAQDIGEARFREGWIGDVITKQNGYEVGSKLHVKYQSRDTQVDRNEIEAYARNGLEYFQSIGAVKNIEVDMVGNNIICRLERDNNTIEKYTALWRKTEVDNA